METPLYTHLTHYHQKNRVSFAMPGHKNGRGLPDGLIDCDVTELPATEDLHAPGKVLRRSQQLLQKLYHADQSYILTGGSTAGIQSLLAAALKPGDLLLSFPDCHMSVINTCALLGVRLKFLPVLYDNSGHCTGFELDEKHLQGVSAVIAVSPDYYGRSKDISSLAALCHQHDIPLLIDQAHGAHYIASEHFPTPATLLGADGTVMSAHKTLDALTGAAYLHINGNKIDKFRLQRALAMVQSSSPSYVIAASAETAAMTLDSNAWEKTICRCEQVKHRVPFAAMENDDPTRMVFFTEGITGFEAEQHLADAFQIDIEMADSVSIVLIATPSNTEEDFTRLEKALQSLQGGKTTPASICPYPPLESFSPSIGFFSESEMVSLKNAVGRIAADTVTAYPPGIPILCCGAPITAQMIESVKELLQKGAKLTGLTEEHHIRVIQ